jgi:hypothetical protein
MRSAERAPVDLASAGMAEAFSQELFSLSLRSARTHASNLPEHSVNRPSFFRSRVSLVGVISGLRAMPHCCGGRYSDRWAASTARPVAGEKSHLVVAGYFVGYQSPRGSNCMLAAPTSSAHKAFAYTRSCSHLVGRHERLRPYSGRKPLAGKRRNTPRQCRQ